MPTDKSSDILHIQITFYKSELDCSTLLLDCYQILSLNFRPSTETVSREDSTIDFATEIYLLKRPDQKHGCLRYRGFFSPTFINPCFRYSPIVNIETWISKIRDFQTSMFSIFTIIYKFLKVFHRFIKVGFFLQLL